MIVLNTMADPYAAPDSDALFEVVNGTRVEKPMGLTEQVLGGDLHGYLVAYARLSGHGRAVVETMFAIPGSGNDRKPDLAFVAYDTWPKDRRIPRTNAWAVAPDLAVEVVSPSDAAFDVVAKVHEYFAGGVKQVWLVWSHVEHVYVFESSTTVRVLTRADTLTSESLLPGFQLPLIELFPHYDESP